MRNSRITVVILLIIGLMSACRGPVCRAVAGRPAAVAQQDGKSDGALLAWIRFEKGGKTYAEIPYLWLGDVNINLGVDVKPSPQHTLHLRWGPKRGLPSSWPRVRNCGGRWFRHDMSFAIKKAA